MITKNGKTLMKYVFGLAAMAAIDKNKVALKELITVKDASGVVYEISPYNFTIPYLFPLDKGLSDSMLRIGSGASKDPAGSFSNTPQRYGIFFGSGSTEPSEDDYTIETPLNNTFINATILPSAVNVWNTYDGAVVVDTTFNVQNKLSSEVTISEIGLFSYPGSIIKGLKSIMIDHTLFESPVTFAANETKPILYRLRIGDGR